ncbi:DUF192 domain-containing protein [Aurantimonas sp. MSK8Z-1]|uniref:DUF192 domain-containing protein n=1 Tax=Mangrovibrevibacter kandeliae TaxID=2968473 RepID=UPI0021176751|nr:DUF192 domain-containing protein [Aurantimonas sp. MSK8Z-1]MCW4114469.1 DUF192 domain-containing protein [Aurantimonas sp. MSK8Z-1]
MRRLILGAAAILVAGVLGYAAAFAGASTAVLTTKSGEHRISVEVVDTPQSREVGLMNRESLPADSGMLFVFQENRPVAFWMKNTLIPLDMLFMDPTGKVTHIATNAQPLSLDLVPSGGPATYVLEINGGAAARYGVAVGDRLTHPAIKGD